MIKTDRTKAAIILVWIALVASLQYITDLSEHSHDVLYKGLFFLPVIVSAIWFGLQGALMTSGIITAILIPFTFLHWR